MNCKKIDQALENADAYEDDEEIALALATVSTAGLGDFGEDDAGENTDRMLDMVPLFVILRAAATLRERNRGLTWWLLMFVFLCFAGFSLLWARVSGDFRRGANLRL